MFDDVKLTKKAIFKCSDEDRASFPQSKPALAISVGQPAHENGDFMATLVSVNKNFQSCSIMVCDSLQRFSTKIYNLTKSMIEVHNEANLEGEKWLERTSPLIAELDIPYQIIRWDYWLNHPDYKHSYQTILNLFDQEAKFSKALINNALDFSTRFINKHNINRDTLHINEIIELSQDYLKEEYAIILIWLQYEYEFILYPVGLNLALECVRELLNVKDKVDFIKQVGIKVRNK